MITYRVDQLRKRALTLHHDRARLRQTARLPGKGAKHRRDHGSSLKTADHSLWSLEEQFWTCERVFIEAHLHPECVMVLPGVGLASGHGLQDLLETRLTPSGVSVSQEVAVRATKDTYLLGYVVKLRRKGLEEYLGTCSSVYVRGSENWLMIQHHQTIMHEEARREFANWHR